MQYRVFFSLSIADTCPTNIHSAFIYFKPEARVVVAFAAVDGMLLPHKQFFIFKY